jgi:tRNA-specific 2-thiouridylase
MSRAALQHTMLPLGDLEKPEVRAIAEELKLPVFNKPDSQEICFVPDQDYAGLIRRRTPDALRPGEFVTTDGAVVGSHEGHQQFTVGQRKGLRLAMGRPVYVTDIDSRTNRVTVGERADLDRTSLVAHQLNLLDERLMIGADPIRCLAKIRYNHEPQPATAEITAGDTLVVRFDTPQPAITPGQAVVVYDGDIVMGGGWIESAQS